MKVRHRNRLRGEDGSVLVEALIVVPVFTLFTIGVLEFGNVLWQRNQLETGVRDAARYWSRCALEPAGSWPGGLCSLTIARNIAFYGNPTGSGDLRVPGWNDASELVIEPVTPPSLPEADDLVTATGTAAYEGSPLFNALGIPDITISYAHQERFIGW